MDKMAQYFSMDTGIISELSAVDYWESWVPNFDCQIIYTVDERMNRLTIFHFDENNSEPYYLFSGGGPLGSSGFSMLSPKDVETYTWYYSNPESFQHKIFIADYGNRRILGINYISHEGLVNGTRGQDSVEFGGSFGENVLLGPTGISIPKGLEGEMLVADFDGNKVYHFSETGSLLNSYGAKDFNATEFYPYKIAGIEKDGELWIMVISGDKYEKVMGSNIFLIKIVSGIATAIANFDMLEPIDVDANNDLGFMVLRSNNAIQQISLDGEMVNTYDLSTHDPGVSKEFSFSLWNDKVALSYDYDQDSGFAVYKKTGGAVGTEIDNLVVFNEFDPVQFNVHIAKSGSYTCYVRRKNSIVYNTFWSGHPADVGIFPFEWSCSDCAPVEYQITVFDDEKNDIASIDEFSMNWGPKLDILSPEGGQEFFEGQRVNFSCLVDFSNNATIDSLVVYLENVNNGELPERWIRKPGNQNYRGQVSFKFDLPEFKGEAGCVWQYVVEARAYYTYQGTVHWSSTYVNPNILIRCSDPGGGITPIPCVEPCFAGDGRIWFPGDLNIYVGQDLSSGIVKFFVRPNLSTNIQIFDLRGRRVGEVVASSDIHGIPGKEMNVTSLSLSSGVYFARIGPGGKNVTRFILLR